MGKTAASKRRSADEHFPGVNSLQNLPQIAAAVANKLHVGIERLTVEVFALRNLPGTDGEAQMLNTLAIGNATIDNVIEQLTIIPAPKGHVGKVRLWYRELNVEQLGSIYAVRYGELLGGRLN